MTLFTIKQIVFIGFLIITFSTFFFTTFKIYRFFKLTKPYPIKDFGKRFLVLFKVAFGQTTILRKPVVGFMHALVFWGFMVILFGSIEVVFDGILGSERFFAFLGPVYNIIIGLGDFFAYIIFFCIIAFLIRRIIIKVNRFEGEEMKAKSHRDANISLLLILTLMISLFFTNIFYIVLNPNNYSGVFPISKYLAPLFDGISYDTAYFLHELNWWLHILLIFFFANYLPYSKHFHVFMSLPNVFLSRLEPLGKLDTMESVLREVKIMLNPNAVIENSIEPASRFGVKDVTDASWKNYLDALTCTQCGRCTAVCPANLTGKKLSPRKIFIDYRSRMKELGTLIIKNGKDFTDNKSLIRDYISEEEIWACTTCNACAKECPVNINHPTLIIDLRRYLVMEESKAPTLINNMFSNIENNGAPWQYSAEDRLLWTEDLNKSQTN
ncbi:MAG: 4Fe-4S dicluster domain-containing protein [Bacteroidales bacterium]|nr:4Fe-4S dicluster domain-containing protein [Bacteroidales bacterium]